VNRDGSLSGGWRNVRAVPGGGPGLDLGGTKNFTIMQILKRGENEPVVVFETRMQKAENEAMTPAKRDGGLLNAQLYAGPPSRRAPLGGARGIPLRRGWPA